MQKGFKMLITTGGICFLHICMYMCKKPGVLLGFVWGFFWLVVFGFFFWSGYAINWLLSFVDRCAFSGKAAL